jgi:hypothetical protein
MEPLNPRYWLARHVYVCRAGEAVIFLNTQTDNYGAVVGEQMHLLGAVVHGWPAEAAAGDDERAREIAEQLVERGMLTADAAAGKPATPTQLTASAVSVAVGLDLMEERAIRLWDIVNFLNARLRASLSLRWHGLQKTLDAVHARKLKHAGAVFDVQQTVELVCVFRRLRCYFVMLRERCLLHSLVLANFLASYGIFPTFVIGVRLQPWAAHSWVQQDEFVLDTTPAKVRDYTPIVAT